MRIAVSGGGIAGLAAALAALRAGHDVQLITGGPAPTPIIGGVQIAPNGWDALSARWVLPMPYCQMLTASPTLRFVI